MNVHSNSHSPFRVRVQNRRLSEFPGRKSARRASAYRVNVAGVLSRIG